MSQSKRVIFPAPARFLALVPAVCGMLYAMSSMAATPVPPQEQNPAIDAIFAEYDQANVPGCALGVLKDGEWLYRRGYGMASLEYKHPITSQSIFRTASVGKQFTATAIALLAESGTISLEDSLGVYFTEFPAWATYISIDQLVYHTSGIRDYLQLAFLTGKGSDADYYTGDWVIRTLARQKETNFPPGSQFLYSNSGYLLMAHLVERVTGQTLREYSDEHIFVPLGMRRTHFHDDHTEVVPMRAYGYAPTDDGFQISMTTLDMVGDGGVFTSIDELRAWDRNFYINSLGKGGPALIELLTTPGQLNDGSAITYAFGLDVDEYRGQKLVSHDGAFVGYRSGLYRFPDQHFSVMVLCNRADSNPEKLALQVSDVFLADVLEPKAEGASLPDFVLSEQELHKFAGDFWEAEEAFAAESRIIDGQLWAVHSPTRKNVLRPVADNRFQMMDVPAEVFVEFELENNQVKTLRRYINGRAQGLFTPFQRLQLTPAQLSAYTGDFYSVELDTTYSLSVADGKLWFDLDDEGPQELTAMFGETFENPDYGAFTFERDASNGVTGFKLQSGRVRNLAFVKR